MFQPGISPCKAEFPDVKIRRKIIEHYLKDICNLTQQYGIYTIEFSTQRTAHNKYVIQTDDIDLEFSKVFIEYIKSIQYHNSIFTNEVFAIIYSYISILKKTEVQSTSPTETSKHTKVRNEITLFSTFLHIIRENFTNNDVSQNTKHDLEKLLAWIIIDYFTHNLDLISQARKNFRPQSTNDDTVIAEQSDYVWDPKGNTFINPVIILAKRESLKIVLDARYLNSLIDESKCNWPLEPIQVILIKINGKNFTTADMNSAYNQVPLDEQSRRLTQFVFENQQYEINRLFYGIPRTSSFFSFYE